MKSVDLKDFEIIVAIVEEGTLSKAAEKVFLTQPSVSRTLIKVEKNLGIELFDKTKTPWSLT